MPAPWSSKTEARTIVPGIALPLECLHYIHAKAGRLVPRPLGAVVHAENVGEVLHFAFLHLGVGRPLGTERLAPSVWRHEKCFHGRRSLVSMTQTAEIISCSWHACKFLEYGLSVQFHAAHTSFQSLFVRRTSGRKNTHSQPSERPDIKCTQFMKSPIFSRRRFNP